MTGGLVSLAITNSLVVAASDLLAGRRLSAACPLVFGDAAALTLLDAGSLGRAGPGYVCAASEVSVEGCPHRAAGCDFNAFRPVISESGNSVVLVLSGFRIFVR